MKEAYAALISAADQAGEDYEKFKDDSYYSYVYVNKRDVLAEAAERLKASGDVKAELEKLRAYYAMYSRHVEEEQLHPTFDWAGDHVWEMIYTGSADGAKQAITILEKYIDGLNLKSSDNEFLAKPLKKGDTSNSRC